ncbi:hypothetical protein [Pasteurella multocida]|uniref:hypothetical protein n=1 Tax=Pasteurella multocida TaxID=747 RepID=UPI00077610B8|nr:hypothetical protein [Pasteurella multocida]AMM81513.1 hypothetical protein AW43_03550 [Pasteurella multocida subsp. multocida PMTB2.1]ATC21361.1 hypothetical protein CLD33_04505 [Pasteurella multocida]MCL7849502.1 hypothetical protein [Pasteurella multocida]MCT8983700.1 hypothetical protein [Pasteurella multocida]MDT8779435.1 hypothetical protein [Pasteurella multocida]
MKELKSSYQDAYEIFQYYWRIYGGWKALFCSPYLHVAILFLVLTQHQWLTRGWWEQSFAILPNLLGFSLGGFAIFLGFGDEQFRSVLAEKDENEPYSAYTFVSATFVHFILIQCLGIVSALLAESLAYQPIWLDDATMYYFEYITPVFWAIGYLFLLYSLTSILAVVMAIFRCTRWYEIHQKINSENDEDN